MSADDTPDDESEQPTEGKKVRERLEEEADRAVTGFDEGIVDLLSWVLETETRARIYVYLRQHPDSTSDEIADGTGLYPSTVREALAQLNEEKKVFRRKRESGGAGNNPYEYSAMAPSELVTSIVDDVQSELNTVFNLDTVLDSSRGRTGTESDPVTITVEDAEGERNQTDAGNVSVDGGEERDTESEEREGVDEVGGPAGADDERDDRDGPGPDSSP